MKLPRVGNGESKDCIVMWTNHIPKFDSKIKFGGITATYSDLVCEGELIITWALYHLCNIDHYKRVRATNKILSSVKEKRKTFIRELWVHLKSGCSKLFKLRLINVLIISYDKLRHQNAVCKFVKSVIFKTLIVAYTASGRPHSAKNFSPFTNRSSLASIKKYRNKINSWRIKQPRMLVDATFFSLPWKSKIWRWLSNSHGRGRSFTVLNRANFSPFSSSFSLFFTKEKCDFIVTLT